MAADRWDTPRYAGAGAASQLKQRCLDFIVDNYQEVVTAPTYEELATSGHIQLEIQRAIAPFVTKPPGGVSSSPYSTKPLGSSPYSAAAPAAKRQRRS